MTAKEKLLQQVLALNEDEASAARIVIERGDDASDHELDAILEAEAEDVLGELDAQEKAAGLRPPRA